MRVEHFSLLVWISADGSIARMSVDLARVIRPGDGILVAQACAEPQTLTEALVAQRAAFSGATLFLGVNYAGIVEPEHADHLRLTSYCGAGHNRALADAGVLDIHPHPYSRFGALIRSRAIPADVVLVQVSPPNERGEYSLGLAAEYLVPALETCRAIVAEVNERIPWTHSERLLRESDLALAVPSSRAPVPLPYGAPGELEKTIARHAAEFVPDGATLEFGLGALPDAVLGSVADRKRLRVHSGALGDGIVDLVRRGIIDQAVGGLVFGTQKFFDLAHKNPLVQLRSSDYTHDPRVLGGIERFVAINSAVEVDLTGQVNAELAGGSYVGAVGGALDFIRAANQSPGGVSLIVLPSAVGTKASRIVSELSGPVATPRSEAGVIVTEHGAADLRGCTLRERAKRMLRIAHPAFRDGLAQQAREAGMLR
jgi:acetyl-CoA hydrolase